MGLAEAMSIGLPVIGFKNCSAVNELIQHGVNGILCDDGIHNLSYALIELIEDENKRIRYGRQAKEDIKEYSSEVVYDKWERLIQKAIY